MLCRERTSQDWPLSHFVRLLVFSSPVVGGVIEGRQEAALELFEERLMSEVENTVGGGGPVESSRSEGSLVSPAASASWDDRATHTSTHL